MSLKDQTWVEFVIELPAEAWELLSPDLFAVGCLGASEEKLGAGLRVRAYFDPADGERAQSALDLALTHLKFGVVRSTIPYGNWADGWRAFFKPLRIGKRIVVTPTWEHPEIGATDVVVRIDPGMAFGTGTHETTQLCLELLEDLVKPGNTMLDVGTGTAILSIAAHYLGAKDVLGIDVDEDAVAIANENVTANGVSSGITMSAEQLRHVSARYDIVVANIIMEKLLPLAQDLAAHVAPGGRLISAGMLAIQRTESIAAFEAAGLTLIEERTLPPLTGREEDRWIALLWQ